MRKLDADSLNDNWKFIVFISLVLIVIPFVIYHFATMDIELYDRNLRNRLEDKLTKEIKDIPLPPKTAVNNFQSIGKRFSILIVTRYRTEIGQEEFVLHLRKELEKTGWFFYEKGSSGGYDFCRGKQDASLYYENQGGLFGDGGNYYKVHFSVDLGPMIDFSSSRPANCK